MKTQQELEAQSREAVIAQINDPNVKIEYCHKEKETWHTKYSYPAFDLNTYHYRIAKSRKFYRVGKNKDGLPFVIYGEGEEYWQSQPNFEEWLDERKYYD